MKVDQRTGAGAGGFVAVVGAVGVVFGDIGTSVLYAMGTVLREGTSRGRPLDPELVYGMTSTVLWSMFLIVTVLYVRLLLRADNDGEGGLLALLGLLRTHVRGVRAVAALGLLGMVGSAMFLGDSVITPAISVLSAAEGLELADPGLARAVVPLAVVVLAALFVLQRFGTARIGRLFGPIMMVWFGVIAVVGAVAVAREPSVLQALSPHWVVLYVRDEPLVAFLSLGAVVLAVTGAEALYADLGHLGRRAITRGWLFVVFPALVLSYLGQAAVVVGDPSSAGNPFFALVPAWGRIPMVVLATLATIIASQAVISGAFTVVHQATRLGFLPPLRILHTSREHVGQIYLPAVNWVLATAVLVLVVTFGSSASLASAYGVAVTTTITVTTSMYLTLTWQRERRVTGSLVVAGSVLLVILVFLAANVPKVATGGWLPLGIGLVLVVLMTTWQTGQRRIDEARHRHETSVRSILDEVADDATDTHRTSGSAVFFTRHAGVAPMALCTSVQQNHVLHRQVVLLSWSTADTPTVADDERVSVDLLGDPGDGVVQVVAVFGFREHPDVMAVLRRARRLAGGELDGLDTSDAVFFVSLPVVQVSRESSMVRWRQRLFVAVTRMTPDPVELLDLPRDRTVVVGRELTL
ncbi:KUP/HAK/KT family potassium transporter [Solicola sp. PLA-1-18]|uniref:KUP/HAK/KT family potassium transporter n=1 Tax=Solicola sp. PLA-1-18 TaxID=3380532 RepID=UPI003B7FDCFA